MTGRSSWLDRRRFMGVLSGLGLAGTTFPDLLWAAAAKKSELTTATIAAAESLAGLEFTQEERELMLDGLRDRAESYNKLREIPIDNSVPPAFQFNPELPGSSRPQAPPRQRLSRPRISTPPDSNEELAYLPVRDLGHLIRTRQVTSVQLTQLYLDRLKTFDPQLHCVVSLTEERALNQARRTDREIAAGTWRGPLHGIPWGAKDLLTARGYPTTWGAAPFRKQELDDDATVIKRLDEAGAVLVAKLSLGALAWGDVWFNAMTRNPWNLEQGSSGSSAGPGSAVSAGLVGFAIGSETWGSIVSPSTRCGVTGLRPTFGRVSRHGAMALSWSMDKLGPMCRSVEDCGLVFAAIQGSDELDPTAVDHPYSWDSHLGISGLRIGYVVSAFEGDPAADIEDPELAARRQEGRRLDLQVLSQLRALGADLLPIELPDLPVDALGFILNAEAAAAFDDLTRSNKDDQLVRQIANAWPNAFRQARTIPAVEYIQANRVRTLVMREMNRLMAGIDVYVCPSFGSSNLLLTNLTGHPAVVVPSGFRGDDNTPVSITFTGRLFGEPELLAVAQAFQNATSHHRLHPKLDPSRQTPAFPEKE
ncbi:MAG: amidase [bacterium]|nr:amidase [bacterium]